MRGDSSLRKLPAEALTPMASRLRVRDDRLPLSGYERDHLFLNELVAGRGFVEVSRLSGLDHPGDGRSFVLLDLDRDGAQDVAVASANAPLLQVFRNQAAAEARPFVAVRCEGGNHTPTATQGLAPRDGVGAQIRVEAAGRTHVRHVARGEGLAAQNSGTLLVGLGGAASATRVSVRWPSGSEQELHQVPSGTLLTFRETRDVSREPYGPPTHLPPLSKQLPRLRLGARDAPTTGASLVVYLNTATWCPACTRALPQLRTLRERFSPEELALRAVAADPQDGAEAWGRYVAKHTPPYGRVATDEADLEDWRGHLLRTLGATPLPAAVITDREGRVLRVVLGAPTVADVLAAGSGRRSE